MSTLPAGMPALPVEPEQSDTNYRRGAPSVRLGDRQNCFVSDNLLFEFLVNQLRYVANQQVRAPIVSRTGDLNRNQILFATRHSD